MTMLFFFTHILMRDIIIPPTDQKVVPNRQVGVNGVSGIRYLVVSWRFAISIQFFKLFRTGGL